jgi:hypothetical protein
MFRHSMRLAAVGAILVGSAVGSVFISTGVASASAPTVTCTGFTATEAGVGTLTGCNDTKNTGGKGTAKAVIKKSTATITWNKTGTTTEKYTESGVKASKCAKGDGEIKEVSTTTGGTNPALKSIPKGQVATAYLCLNPHTKKVTLLPGTKYQV